VNFLLFQVSDIEELPRLQAKKVREPGLIEGEPGQLGQISGIRTIIAGQHWLGHAFKPIN